MHSSLTTIARKSTSAIAMLGIAASGFLSLGGASIANASAPNWNVTGSYTVDMQYQGSDNTHTISLTQDASGNLTGNGGDGPYTWVIDSGLVSGDNLSFTAHYTATDEASTTVLQVMGTIAADGTLSGTWSDNFPGPADASTTRTGALTTLTGAAVAIVAPHLDAPTLLVPANGSATTTAGQASVSWSSVTDPVGGITYIYQASNANSTNPDGSFMTPIYTSSPLSTTTLATPGTASGTYYWHVMATDASSTMSDWSTPWSFIVNNETGTTTGPGNGGTGTIGGTVNGGNGTLKVTSIDSVDTSAIDNGTFGDGWKYVFHITVPDNETNLAMKFADWTGMGSSTIPVANNIRISSTQAASTTSVVLTGTNTYSSPALHITGDLDPSMPGDQVDVTVEVSVPSGTPNGSYTTTYGVQTLP